MPVRESSAGRLTWAPGEKPAVMAAWLVQVAGHPKVGLPGLRVAVLIADRANSKTGACWVRKGRMATELNVSVSAIKAGLTQLDAASLIIRVQEDIRDARMRVIYPRAPPPAPAPGTLARPDQSRLAKGIDPDAPNGRLTDHALAMRIDAEMWALGYIRRDRRYPTNAVGVAAKAACEAGSDAFREFCRRLMGSERESLTTEVWLKPRQDGDLTGILDRAK